MASYHFVLFFVRAPAGLMFIAMLSYLTQRGHRAREERMLLRTVLND